jgi:hypothetical protein
MITAGIGFAFELLFDGFGLFAVGSAGGMLVPDAIHEKVAPPNVAALH